MIAVYKRFVDLMKKQAQTRPVLRCTYCNLVLDDPDSIFCPRCCRPLAGAGGCTRCRGCGSCGAH